MAEGALRVTRPIDLDALLAKAEAATPHEVRADTCEGRPSLSLWTRDGTDRIAHLGEYTPTGADLALWNAAAGSVIAMVHRVRELERALTAAVEALEATLGVAAESPR